MDKIDKIVYINLDHRTDRNEQIINEFKKINIEKYQRFPAIKRDFGSLGCGLSHVAVLTDFASDDQLQIGMIIEDDAQFQINRQTLDTYIEEFIKDTRSVVLCLGFNARNIQPYNNHFYRTCDTQTTSCYVIKKAFVNTLLSNLSEACDNLASISDRSHAVGNYSIDIYWKRLQHDHIYLIPRQRAVIQRASYSDISKCHTNYYV